MSADPSTFVGTEILFTDTSALLRRLQFLVNDSLAIHENPDAEDVAATSFATALKIALHVESLWRELKSSRFKVCATLLKRLLLEESRKSIRGRVRDYIKTICLDLHL